MWPARPNLDRHSGCGNRIERRNAFKCGSLTEWLVGADKTVDSALPAEFEGHTKLQRIKRAKAARFSMAINESLRVAVMAGQRSHDRQPTALDVSQEPL